MKYSVLLIGGGESDHIQYLVRLHKGLPPGLALLDDICTNLPMLSSHPFSSYVLSMPPLNLYINSLPSCSLSW
jgi:hypothetical protein